MMSNDSRSNSTTEIHPEIRTVLCRSVYPPLVIVGVLCNLLALFTFQQRRLRRSPVSLCLSTLAVLDILVLLSSASRYWSKYQLDFDWQVTNIYACRMTLFLEYFTADCSVWTLLLVTAQRYVGTHFPLRAGKLCKRSRTCLFLLAVFCLCSVKNLPLLIRADIMNLPLAGPLCQILYDPQLWIAFSWTDTTFRFLLPFPSLLILNLSICRKVRSARRNRRNTLMETRSSLHCSSTVNNNNNNSIVAIGAAASVRHYQQRRLSRRATTDPLPSAIDSSDVNNTSYSRRISQLSATAVKPPRPPSHDDGRRMLTMLVVVNFVFLTCQFPLCAFSLGDSLMKWLEKAIGTGNTDRYLALSLCFQLALTLVYVSHATNFFFYCLSGRLFRHTLLKMLRFRPTGPGSSCAGRCCKA